MLVGSPDALEESVHLDVTGKQPPAVWLRGGRVFTGRDEVTFMVLDYHPGATLWRLIAHEYVHVLQRELAGWGSTRAEGIDLGGYEKVRVSPHAPSWHVEGFAVYGDYLYQSTRPERKPFIPWTYSPYRYVECNPLGWVSPELALQRYEQGNPNYDLAFLATIFLMEELPISEGLSVAEGAWLEYWKLLSESEGYWFSEEEAERVYRSRYIVEWQPAFQEAFGISADDFYAAFGVWTRSGVIAERTDPRVTPDPCHASP